MTKPVRRSGSAVYYARCVVPLDVQPLAGRKQIWKSLNETSLERAKPLERAQQQAWHGWFEELRARPRLPAKSVGMASPFHSQEEEEWLTQVWTQDALEAEERSDVHEAAMEADPLYRERHLLAERMRAEREKLEIQAEYEYEQAQARKAAKAAKATAPGTSLSVMVERWAAFRKPDPKSVDRMKAVVSWFGDMMGPLPVETISPEDVRSWVDRLHEKGVSPANAKTKLQNLNTLLRFALLKDRAKVIASNPADGVSVEVKATPEDAIKPFDLPALRAIFTSPIYAASERPEGGAGDAAYWLPLLALFTGARLNEIGQLRPKDIVQQSYTDKDDNEQTVWVILIVADKAEGLKLKNVWSTRRVPIHPELIRLGFLDRVEASRTAGHPRIFGNLRPDKYGTITANWSKWFGRYLRGVCQVSDDRMRFHSFRHGFKDYVREAELGEDVNDALTGHKGEAVARRYGQALNYPLRPLVTAMSVIRVPGLELPAPPPNLSTE